MPRWSWVAFCFLAQAMFLSESATSQDFRGGAGVWRLPSLPPPPEWVKVSGHQRTRYETLDDQFRANLNGSDQMFAFRTDLKIEIDLENLDVVAEFMDSRQELADDGSPLDNSMVNTFELLQGYIALDLPSGFQSGSEGRIQIGRQTMDIGSRRLVARNRFRNTINSFTGIHGEWTNQGGDILQAFYFLPVERRPSDFESLLDNESEFDDEDFGTQFWGIHFTSPEIRPGVNGELYLYGLNEEDRPDRPTRDRNLVTTGIRMVREPEPGCYDFEWESVFQAGESRASTSVTDTNDLDHRSHFHHVSAGYSFDQAYSPNLSFLFDYGSGDEDPDDNENNRFDTLYGARRFEFGPTGIYGAFSRSNLISPGYRLTMEPCKNVNFMVAHRFNWLASDRDAWTTSGLRDRDGNSGSFIGHQAEVQVRWKVIPDKLNLDIGAAHLFSGEFMDNAPNSNGEGDSTYAYVETVLTF